jgi:hypothetical protein
MAGRHLPHCQTRGCELEASTQRHLEVLGEALIEAEGALALERERRRVAERELALVERALLRLLQSGGSEVADRRDLRLELGLPA